MQGKGQEGIGRERERGENGDIIFGPIDKMPPLHKTAVTKEQPVGVTFCLSSNFWDYSV